MQGVPIEDECCADSAGEYDFIVTVTTAPERGCWLCGPMAAWNDPRRPIRHGELG